MRETLKRFPDVCVCFEFSPEALTELGFDPAQLLEFFRAKGYRIYILNRDSLKPLSDLATIESMLGSAGYVDLLCSKREII